MGNHKFKLSDMIPNAWFFKLKDMSKHPIKPQPHSLSSSSKHKKHRHPASPLSAIKTAVSPLNLETPRKSYHITRELTVELPEYPSLSPPRKSKSSSSTKSRKSTRKNPTSSSSVSTTTTIDSSLSPPPEPEKLKRFDIVIDVSKPYLELPRIVTKPAKATPNLKDHQQKIGTPARRFSGGSPAVGVRLKVNSPRIMARKQGQNGNNPGRRSLSSTSNTTSTSTSTSTWRKRRSISESFAVVKSSRDPQKDFRESMVEMIVQNNLMASKDLEDLLACYLSLNSDEYHDVIIKVFKQLWFDLIHLRHQKLVS